MLNAMLAHEAIKFSNEKHAGQVRKGSGDPYITHPIAVSYIVAAFKRSKALVQLLCAAILHDTLEDTETTYDELERKFGTLVASLVLELTDDKDEIARIGKLEYQKQKVLNYTSYGLVLKLCDRLHNVSDSPTAKTIRDTLELMDHLVANRKLTRPQSALVEAIRTVCLEAQR